jgi:SAM-dependent methyltransferase
VGTKVIAMASTAEEIAASDWGSDSKGAAGYASFSRLQHAGGKHRSSVRRLLQFEQYLPLLSGKTVLDVGCGSGTFLLSCLSQDPSLLIGIDLSPSLIALANSCVQSIHVCADKPSISFFCQNMHHMGLEDSSVDVVVSFFAFHYSEQPVKLAREIARVLRPGGQLLFICNVVDMKGGRGCTPLSGSLSNHPWISITVAVEDGDLRLNLTLEFTRYKNSRIPNFYQH